MMKSENKSCSSIASSFVMLFIFLASLLVLPNSGCNWKSIDNTFKIGQLKYEVITQDQASKTGTVSVRASSINISGDIEIPASVTDGGVIYSVDFIQNGAFAGCNNLTSIVIPDSVTSIERSAFMICNGLTNIIIPNSVTEINDNAFKDCDKLRNVFFKGDAPKLPGGNAFFDPSVIYYKPGTAGWTNPWDGRPTKEWVE